MGPKNWPILTDSVWLQILKILVCDQDKTFLFYDIMFKSGYFQICGLFLSFIFSDLLHVDLSSSSSLVVVVACSTFNLKVKSKNNVKAEHNTVN